MLRSALALTCMLAAAGVQAGKLDLSTAEGANLAMRKIQCSSKDAEPALYWWQGETLSRVPGEPDRRLFRVEGMNVRQCVTIEDPQRGKGWRLVSRELLLYLDPKTGELLKTWQNPWTGKTVQVIHTANDPVNQRPSFTTGRDGAPQRWMGTVNGDQWWLTLTVPLFYENPLGGDYQKHVGGTYHATEMFNFFGDLANLLDDRHPSARVQVGWVRISSWLPWMEMGDRAGLLYFHAAGRKVGGFGDLSPLMREQIETRYPAYRAPPPPDDARPNETSWTYFKKQVPPEKSPGR